MDVCRDQRSAVPPPAERARALAARVKVAAVVATGAETAREARIVPLRHAIAPDATAVLLLPDEHPLHGMIEMTPRGELAAMLEATDVAPLELRQPVRGWLWITGWLRGLAPEQARLAARYATADRPDQRLLLDLPHGTSLVALVPASVVLADAEGSAALAPDELAAAAPDPLRHLEAAWLLHLDAAHPEILDGLRRQVPAAARRGARIRPLALDRLGIRLRVEAADGDHDVRLAFREPVEGPHQLAVELHRLAGCPTSGLGPREQTPGVLRPAPRSAPGG